MKKIYKNLNLVIYLIGIFVSGIGTKLTTIALSDKILKITSNDFSVSLVFILQSIPIIILGIFAGNVIDKRNKKISFIVVNIIFSITSFIFSVTSNSVIIFSIILINGAIQAFYLPIAGALMPSIVNKDELTEANGIKMSINGLVMIIGYAFAGIVVSFIGNNSAFVLDSLSFLFIAITSSFMKINSKSKGEKLSSNYKNDMAEAWNFVKNKSIVKYMFMLEVITTFIISMQTPLTYIFAEKYLGGKAVMASKVGFLFAAAGIGGIVGGVLLGKFKNKNKVILFSASLVLDSIVVIVFSFNRYFPISIIAFGVMGVLGSFTGSILETVIQENTPEKMIGRVFGFISSIVQPVSLFSLLIGGICTGIIEVKWVFVMGSVIEMSTGIYFYDKCHITKC